MEKFFSSRKIKQFFEGVSNVWVFASLVFVVTALTLFPHTTYAADDLLSQITGAVNSGIAQSALKITLSVVLAPVAILCYGILTIANYFFWIVGTLFNWSVVYLVFQFATTIGNSPGMLVAWGVLRDFANIVLLFGFIFMGVMLILDLNQHTYPINKTIPKFIIYAVILNFSLLGAGAIIDASNVFTAAMYNQTIGASCVKGASSADCTQGVNVGLAGKIAEESRIGTIFSGDGSMLKNFETNITNYTQDPLKYITVFLGLALFVTTAAAVLLAGAVLLISRAITLAFVMVTSPIGIIANAVPGLEKIGKQWWDALIQNALFAPVFLILLFVSLKIVEGVETRLGGNGSNLLDALTQGDSTLMGSVVVFALVIGFMLAALITAKKLSISGADGAYQQATKFIGGSASIATGAPFWRATIGGGSIAAGKLIRRSPLGGTVIGRGLTAVTDKGASSSFDFRGIKAVKGAQFAGEGLNLGQASKAAKGGRQGIIDNKEGNAAKKKYTEGVQKERNAQLKEKQSEIDTQLKDVSTKQADVDTRIQTARAAGDEAGAVALEKGEKKALEDQARALKRKRLALVSGSLTESQRGELAAVEGEHLAATREQKELLREDENSELGTLKATLDMNKRWGANAAEELRKLDEATSREALEAEVRAEADHNGLAWSDAYIQNQVTARQQESKARRAELVGRIEQHKKQEEETSEKIRLHGERIRENTARIEQATKKLDEGMAKAETLGQAAFATSAVEDYLQSERTLGLGFLDRAKMDATVAALRKKEAGGVEGALGHLVHEIHAASAPAAHDDHAPAPAAAKPAAAKPSGGDHGGGGHH